ncbi:hypothetical protein Ancab_023865 [Ancistrocladus abbreviatus]
MDEWYGRTFDRGCFDPTRDPNLENKIVIRSSRECEGEDEPFGNLQACIGLLDSKIPCSEDDCVGPIGAAEGGGPHGPGVRPNWDSPILGHGNIVIKGTNVLNTLEEFDERCNPHPSLIQWATPSLLGCARVESHNMQANMMMGREPLASKRAPSERGKSKVKRKRVNKLVLGVNCLNLSTKVSKRMISLGIVRSRSINSSSGNT